MGIQDNFLGYFMVCRENSRCFFFFCTFRSLDLLFYCHQLLAAKLEGN